MPTAESTDSAARAEDYVARGRIVRVGEDRVVFNPLNFNYELELETPSAASLKDRVGLRIECLIRVRARKILTVPSGGNFIQPIFGPPRIIQDRIRHVEPRRMVVHAGTPILVELPDDESAYDLVNGPLASGGLVNVTAWPGARFDLVEAHTSGS